MKVKWNSERITDWSIFFSGAMSRVVLWALLALAAGAAVEVDWTGLERASLTAGVNETLRFLCSAGACLSEAACWGKPLDRESARAEARQGEEKRRTKKKREKKKTKRNRILF